MGKKPVTILERNRLLSRGFYHENSTGRQEDCLKISNVNNYDNQPDIIKRYLVYMELPKIKIGDYHKSSCVVGSLLRFHFLIKIAQNEKIPLVLLPIRDYKVPVVNVAVIHRPFIEDEDAKGPIPKSPGATSPLICYKQDNAGSETPLEKVEDFRKGSAAISKEPGAQVGVSPSTKEKVRDDPISADCWDKGPISKSPGATSPLNRYKQDNAGSETSLEKVKEDFRKGSATISKEPGAQAGVPPSTKQKVQDDPISAEKPKCQKTSSRHRHRNKKRKKYFVYCELPKVAIGDYRIASVISTEIIYCHFIMKIAQDEVRGQPVLRPIKKYHKPRINFAVIHRALIVDDEAAGPIPRSPGIKSPMIRQGADDENDGDEDGDDDGDDDGNTFRGVLHTFIGFNFSAAAPTSKYPLVSQWSLVPDEAGSMTPELVLSKAKG